MKVRKPYVGYKPVKAAAVSGIGVYLATTQCTCNQCTRHTSDCTCKAVDSLATGPSHNLQYTMISRLKVELTVIHSHCECIPLTLMAMLVGEGLEGSTSVDLPRSREVWRKEKWKRGRRGRCKLGRKDGKHGGVNAD